MFDIRVGQVGQWRLLPPFELSLNTELQYTCIAIRKLKDYILEGVDVYTDIYKKMEINNTIYEEDVNNDISIVTLQNEVGELIKVPESYFKETPITDGIIYYVKILGFSLGPLPNDLDLTYASQKCKELLLSILGVQSTPKTIIVSSPKLVSYEEDLIATAARNALKTNSNTEYSKILELENRIAELQTKINTYEEFIKDKYIPPV